MMAALPCEVRLKLAPCPEELAAIFTYDPGIGEGILRDTQPDRVAERAFELWSRYSSDMADRTYPTEKT